MSEIGASVDDFEPAPARLVGERQERMEQGKKRLRYEVSFLDDYLRGIAPHDLILLGAPSGMGKTDLALNIAASNAMAGRRVHYFALEAEPRELERRTKYALISRRMYETRHEHRDRMNYTDWYLGDLEGICGEYNAWADEVILKQLSKLQTYYRGAEFTAETLERKVQEVHERSQLIVIDHLHYIDIDSDDENENRSIGGVVKKIRDISLRIGVPILLVAHLRKRDPRAKQIIATLDDFHGSSNITKIATQAIAIERAVGIDSDKWWKAPTFMSVIKDRRGGACPFTALSWFDRRTKGYGKAYSLGRISSSQWEEVGARENPSWAANHEWLVPPNMREK